jgi:thioredoxin 1
MSFTSQYTNAEPTRAEIDAMAGPVLLEFGTPWCGYCQAVQATLKEMLERHPEITHIKVYDARGKPLGRSFRVKLWPNLVFLRDGEMRMQLARPSEAAIFSGLQAIAPTSVSKE